MTPEEKRVYNKAWYLAHQNERAAYDRAYRKSLNEETKEKRRAQVRAYAATHKEAAQAYSIEYRRKHRDELLAKARARAQATRTHKQVYDARYRSEQKDALKQRKRVYYETHREEILTKTHAYFAQHKPEMILANKAWRKTHRDEVREAGKRHRARKAKTPRNDLTLEQWRGIKAAFDHRCAYCQRKMRRLEQDHLTPLSKGGAHTLSNVVPACRSCNAHKSAGPVLRPVQPLFLL